VHYCLGVQLARVELAEALRVITSHVQSPSHGLAAVEADHRVIGLHNTFHRIQRWSSQLALSVATING
jgi:cytochrome P450